MPESIAQPVSLQQSLGKVLSETFGKHVGRTMLAKLFAPHPGNFYVYRKNNLHIWTTDYDVDETAYDMWRFHYPVILHYPNAKVSYDFRISGNHTTSFPDIVLGVFSTYDVLKARQQKVMSTCLRIQDENQTMRIDRF